MHKAIAFAAAALVVAVPALAAACLNGTLIEDRDIQQLKSAELLLVAGQYRGALRAIADYPYWSDDFEGEHAEAFLRRARLLAATAQLRLLAQKKPIDVDRLANVVEQLRSLQYDNGHTPPLQKARLAEALVLMPKGMEEAKLLIEDLVKRDVVPEAEAWVTAAKVRAYLHDLDGMGAALRRCEKMAGKRKQICHGPDMTS